MLDGFIISLSWVALVLGGLCWGEWVNSAQMRRVETKKRSKTLQVKSNFCRSFQSKSGEQSTFTKQPIYHCKWTQFTNCHDEWANGFLTTYNLLSTLESSLFVLFAVFFSPIHFISLAYFIFGVCCHISEKKLSGQIEAVNFCLHSTEKWWAFC